MIIIIITIIKPIIIAYSNDIWRKFEKILHKYAAKIRKTRFL